MNDHETLLITLKNRWPEIEVSVDVLPSCVAWIDLRLEGSTLVIECSVDGTFGMSVVPDGSAGGFGGHDAEFESRDELLSALDAVLSKV